MWIRALPPPRSPALGLLLMLGSVGCRQGPADKGPGDDDTGDTDSGGHSGDSGHTAPTTLRFTAEVEGPVVVELSPADPTQAPRRLEAVLGEPLAVDLPAGGWTVHAWVEADEPVESATWQGAWAEVPEPAARFGFVVPRAPLEVPLRNGPPRVRLDEHPEWAALHDLAWARLTAHVHTGTPENGLRAAYLDEAFSDQLFQWDTCFMARFGRHAGDDLPVMESLDNFYDHQRADGYIGRVINETDGVMAEPADPSEPMVNPPLFAWVELAWVEQTGDRSRLGRVLPILDAYHDWIDTNLRTEPGLYYTSMLGSGMDNAPRDLAYDAWVDMSAQQALAREALATLWRLAGDEARADAEAAEHARICVDVAAFTWDGAQGWFEDLDIDGRPLPDKTLAGIWPLVAGCASDAQAQAAITTLTDPATFWRLHPFASTAADSSAYEPDGHYWRGGVWAPTNAAAWEALRRYGRDDVADEATAAHLTNLAAVWARYTPPEGTLGDGPGDGTETLWELYAPDSRAPGTRWDDVLLGRTDFVGWTGLGPTDGLYAGVLGLRADALSDTVTWRLDHTGAQAIEGWRVGEQVVDLAVEARTDARADAHLSVHTSDAFTLVVENGGAVTTLPVPAGESVHTVPGASEEAPVRVPAGPYEGSAVLGNGRLAAVVGPDGMVRHLYPGDLGRDLVERAGFVPAAADGAATRRGLDPAFAAWAGGATSGSRAFVGPEDVLVFEGTGAGVARVHLREAPDLDGGVALVAVEQDGAALIATWSDGSALVLLAPEGGVVQAGRFDEDVPDGGPDGSVTLGPDLLVALPDGAWRWGLAAAEDAATARAQAEAALAGDPLAAAQEAWARYDLSSRCGATEACRVASANLYAAAASSVAGAVPADLTGQFTTNGAPQLYPRDAMMVARVLAARGDPERAWEILRTWLGRDGPAPGEWYARYDARGRAVDGGTGAAFDVPEWDANAYAALVVEAVGEERLSTAERALLLDALDFLVAMQDEDGLWTEGGIVEWEGRLPGTTMAAWAGLDAGARLAEAWGEPERAADYRAAAGRARGGLPRLWDGATGTLADEREGRLDWDTSLLFGPALGFPAVGLTDRSYEFARDQARSLGGGVRYFETTDGTGYGADLFHFTTAALLRYARTVGDADTEAESVEWLLATTNQWGLAPERVYADGDGAAPASPLSWCAAEVALQLSEVPASAFDGVPEPGEHGGGGALDRDGGADVAGSPVAAWAHVDDGVLVVALRTAGPWAGGSWAVYLAGPEGDGPLTELGPAALRGDPAGVPGAELRVELDEAGCDLAGCELRGSDLGWELRVPLDALGLGEDVQVVVEGGGPEGEVDRVPDTGALRTGDDGLVLVSFRVTADPADPRGVTLSGDRAELGAWAGDALALHDDGTWGDEWPGDGVYTTTVALPRGGAVAYKYLRGTAGDGSWTGVEFDGADRSLRIDDPDRGGRVIVEEVFGVRGGGVVDE